MISIRRRQIVFSLLGAAAVTPLPTLAQEKKTWRIRFLVSGQPISGPNPHSIAFTTGLRELGYDEGGDYISDVHYANGSPQRLLDLAMEIARLPTDFIVAISTNSALAAQKATTSIPILFLGVSDPVLSGLAVSLAKPGKNLTGISNFAGDLTLKRLELLKDMVPKLNHLGYLRNPENPYPSAIENLRAAAGKLGIRFLEVNSKNPEDIEPAFLKMVKENVGAVVVSGDVYHVDQRKQIADVAIKYRIPSVFPFREGVQAGCLMSYGANQVEPYRRIAFFVDRIIKGAKPGDLPIERPTKFDLVINLKTAKAIGLNVPQSFLLRADEVIE